jgi:hypothetical protein
MDDRLAGLRQEVDKIITAGPIGCWKNPPTTFPMMSETVVFNADGSGLITSRSGMKETSTRAFEWSMQSPGRLVMQYCRGENDENGSDETAEAVEQFDIEIKIQETEFAPWPVLTTRSSDVFGCLWCALARDDPPLALPERPPLVQTKRKLLSRVRDFVARHLKGDAREC